MADQILKAARVRELFSYDPTTGVLTRRVRTSSNAPAGAVAGSVMRMKNGALSYRTMSIDERRYLEHRVIWLHVHGEWPKHELDHINGDRRDNRIENLRDVSKFTNMENQRRAKSNSRSGSLGVSWDASKGKWHAQLFANGKHIARKRFAAKEDAEAFYLEQKRKHHQGCTL